MEKEIWKNIPGYENHYQVSNLGRVKSIKFNKERILKYSKDRGGYFQVVFSKNGQEKAFKIHKLVSIAFHNHTPCGMELVINHIDLDKTNNSAYNLEIVTQRQNGNKKHLKSTSEYVGVHWYKEREKWQSQITINRKRKHLGYFKTEIEAHLAYQKALSNIK